MSLGPVIIILAGKRKSGKDYIADQLVKMIGVDSCVVLRLSSPIKKYFSQKYALDFKEILSSSEYKERLRKEMILWGEEQRNKDAGVFCRPLVEEAKHSGKAVWILSDARRKSDIDFFKNLVLDTNSKLYCIRIESDIDTRKERNWIYTEGIDDAESECGLDTYDKWDFVLQNSNNDDCYKNIEEVVKTLNLHS